MADTTKIEWTDSTWSPITGCTLVSDGCKNCYAARLAATRLKNHPSRKGLARLNAAGEAKFTGEVRFNEEWLDQPLRWRKPRMIFVCAHSDLFHPAVPDEWIDRVFAVMLKSSRHVFQVLTKRPKRMAAYMDALYAEADGNNPEWFRRGFTWPVFDKQKIPFPNIWLGTSVEDQATADERIPHLLATPAAVRFVSAEPPLGPVDLTPWVFNRRKAIRDARRSPTLLNEDQADACIGYPLDWLIVGGESGPGARPMHPDWARSLRDQCARAGVPFFMKQWGTWEWAPDDLNFTDAKAWGRRQFGNVPSEVHSNGHTCFRVGKARAGRLLDGRAHDAMPTGAP
jgi:protein gp37